MKTKATQFPNGGSKEIIPTLIVTLFFSQHKDTETLRSTKKKKLKQSLVLLCGLASLWLNTPE